MEAVELNTVDKNMKFALVKTIIILWKFEEKMRTAIHLKYLHDKNAYSKNNTEC